ncbi:proton-coupled folate transporter-like [Glandiceps talaboti]
MEVLRCLRRTVTVEPLLFCLMFAYSSLSVIRVEYVKQVVGQMYGYSPNTSQSTCEVNKSDPNYILGQKVQSEASYWMLYYEIIPSFLGFFTATFLGSYSERGGGRKIALLIPTVGFVLYMLCILIVLYLNLPLPYLFIGEVIRGLTGNPFTAMAISYAVIADVTPKEHRTFRMIIIETSLFVGGGVSQFSTGYWINSAGFIPPLWMLYSVTIFMTFYIVFWVEETAPLKNDVKWNFQQQYVDIFRLFSESSRRVCFELVVLSMCMLLLFLILGSSSSITTLYMLGPPLCFSSISVGYYQAVFFATNAVGLLIIGKILSCCLTDMGMAQAGFISHIGSYIMVAMAATQTEIFAAPVIGMLASLSFPVIRSRLSKLFDPRKQVREFVHVAKQTEDFVPKTGVGVSIGTTNVVPKTGGGDDDTISIEALDILGIHNDEGDKA